MNEKRSIKRLVADVEAEIVEYNRIIWGQNNNGYRKINHWDRSGGSKAVAVVRRRYSAYMGDPECDERNQGAPARV